MSFFKRSLDDFFFLSSIVNTITHGRRNLLTYEYELFLKMPEERHIVAKHHGTVHLNMLSNMMKYAI